MVDFLSLEGLSCQICMEQFYENEQNVAVSLECGHTICKKCLKDMLNRKREKCPIDQETTIQLPNEYNFTENKIIQRIISLYGNLNIDVKPLTKVYFYYCNNCDSFLSNSASEVHQVIGHLITSIDNYTYDWFDYIAQNISTHKVTTMIKNFLVLYFFQSPYISKIKKFKIKEQFRCNQNKFNFFGETLIKNEENERLFIILSSILSNNNFTNDYSLKKGLLIGENSQVIYGYFLTYKGETKKIIMNGFGITNCEGLIYLGIMKFSLNPSATGFSLDVGLLKNGNFFFFGKFLDNNYECPSYEFEYGEQINFKDDLIEVEMKNKKKDIYYESFHKNKYFSIQNINDKNKITLSKNIFPSSNNSTEIGILMENNNFEINSIELFTPGNTNEEIIITKRIDKQVNDLFLYDSKIFIEKYNIFLFFLEKGFVLCQEYSKKNIFEGYLILPNDENVCFFKFNEIKTVISKVNEFLKSIESLMNLSLKQCKVYYQEFDPTNNFERIKIKDYFEIDAKNNLLKIINGKNNKMKKTEINEKIKNFWVKDLLPNYYDTFKKNKKKNCCCCSSVDSIDNINSNNKVKA